MKSRIVFFVFVSIMLLSVARSALACKGSQILFQDNFATLDPAWGAPNDKQSIKDGKLIIRPEVNQGWALINQGNIFGDMDACINVTMAKSDDASWGGGLVFWAKDYNNYYVLLATGDGQFSVRRYVNGTSSAAVDWRENSALKKGVGQANQLRVVTKGNQATAYINDTEVVTFNGEPPQGGGFIGVKGNSTGKSQIVWEFSNLKITNVSAAPVANVITTPPVANTASGCNGSQVLYQDNFAILDPAWGAPSPNLNVNSGKLVMQPEINNSVVALNQANLFQDMSFCVNVGLVKSDDPSYSAGPIFWAKDSGDYYYMLVSGSGQFAVKRWVNSRVLTPVNWRESAVINKGIGQTNRVQVVTKENQATVYINGTEVITFNGQSPQGGGFIGIISFSPEKAQNKNVWEFSDLRVAK